MSVKIPTTIITGFLGAGKTSLIKHVMQHAAGRRIALLINEFGDVGVDGQILQACSSDSCPSNAIIELPNGCICCTVADDFLPAIEKILALPNLPTHIIIETSGLALPKPLLKAFDWPAIRARLTVDGVIAVVDGPAVFAGDFAEDSAAIAAQKEAMGSLEHDNPLAEVYEDQLLCADMVVLNKTDQMNAAQITQVQQNIASVVRAGVGVVCAAHGQIEPSVLLGLAAAAEGDIANRVSHHDNAPEHDHEDFATCAVAVPVFNSADALHACIEQLAVQHGILRVKGFVQLANKAMPYLVQAVGTRVQGQFVPSAAQVGQLVVIGRHGFDVAAVKALLG